MSILERPFFDRATLHVARDLIGCFLVHDIEGQGIRRGRIIETEAYIGTHDAASHAHRGLTKRNAPMFGPAGFAYVYLIYGIHHCLNVVTEKPGFPAAVLLRALEPIAGGPMRACQGPGRLTRSMGVDLGHNGADLCSYPLYLAPRQQRPKRIIATPRVGVGYAGEWAEKPWRFIDGEVFDLASRR
jgi:DNA-3-methyladenine glycosylase